MPNEVEAAVNPIGDVVAPFRLVQKSYLKGKEWVIGKDLVFISMNKVVKNKVIKR